MSYNVRFPVGLTFTLKRGKQDPKLYTIDDIWVTRNTDDEVVGVEYVCSCDYLGQKLTSRYPDATIAKCLDSEDRLKEFL